MWKREVTRGKEDASWWWLGSLLYVTRPAWGEATWESLLELECQTSFVRMLGIVAGNARKESQNTAYGRFI